jgi:hypothetical protein
MTINDKVRFELEEQNAHWRETYDILSNELQARRHSSEEAVTIVKALLKTVRSGELTDGEDARREGWMPLHLGDFKTGAVVRVSPRAYPADTENKHNGRRGTVTAVRHGVVHVRYAGDSGGGLASTHAHDVSALEILVSE